MNIEHEILTPSGTTVIFVSEPNRGGVDSEEEYVGSRGGKATEKNKVNGDVVLDKVKGFTSIFDNYVKENNAIEEMNIELNMAFSAEAGVIFTSAKSDFGVKINIRLK